MDMREFIKEKSELALIYAEDGSYSAAARVLEDLATRVREHSNEVNRQLIEAAKEPKT
jgi:ATP-dependent protease HslVU (ClpYQ) peptidase subunit